MPTAKKSKEQELTSRLAQTKSDLNAAESRERDLSRQLAASQKSQVNAERDAAAASALKTALGVEQAKVAALETEITRLRTSEDRAKRIIEHAEGLKKLLGSV